eukprot:RCo046991
MTTKPRLVHCPYSCLGMVEAVPPMWCPENFLVHHMLYTPTPPPLPRPVSRYATLPGANGVPSPAGTPIPLVSHQAFSPVNPITAIPVALGHHPQPILGPTFAPSMQLMPPVPGEGVAVKVTVRDAFTPLPRPGQPPSGHGIPVLPDSLQGAGKTTVAVVIGSTPSEHLSRSPLGLLESTGQLPTAPPCNHNIFWKRLRGKRGHGYFMCRLCLGKWKSSACTRREHIPNFSKDSLLKISP